MSEWVCAWVRHALPCGHDSDYSFCPINFKLYMHIRHDERRNPIDFGSRVKGQGQLWHFHCVKADDRGIYNGHHKMADPEEGKFCFDSVLRSIRIFYVMFQCR